MPPKSRLLGSGELGKEVLIALQRLGVETIAVDRYENAPGQQVAHHARTITMSDPAQLKALVEAERPMLVVPEIEAIATPMLEELEAAGAGPRDSHRTCCAPDHGPRRHPPPGSGNHWACQPALTNSATRWPNSRLRLKVRSQAGHRLPLRRQAGDEQLRQGPKQDRRPG